MNTVLPGAWGGLRGVRGGFTFMQAHGCLFSINTSDYPAVSLKQKL